MNLLDHLRLRLDAFIFKRVPFRPALRRDLARYFVTDGRAFEDVLENAEPLGAALAQHLPGRTALRHDLARHFITDTKAFTDMLEIGRQLPGDEHLRAFDAALARHGGQLSFAQAGEDLIVAYIFRVLGIAQPTYLDLGAFDPWELSNTALLHLRGSQGVNIEPNPEQFPRFQQSRPNDKNLNLGIASAAGTLTYHVLDAATLNTFSREEAERCVREEGHRLLREIPVPVQTLPAVLAQYCGGGFPDFVSVDIEGLDQLVVEVIATHATKPKVVCIETISYSRGGQGRKDEALIASLRDCGYLPFADTYINTILVQETVWRELP